MILFRGPSLIDGAPIVVIAISKSTNAKTGDMVQTYILRDDMSPMDAIRSGNDKSICGGCIHRGNGINGKGRTCYVNIGQGPRAVYSRFTGNNPYPVAGSVSDIVNVGRGRMVRLGTYGDPAAVPAHIWTALISEAIGHTGYTHQWRGKLGKAVRTFVMASCDTPEDIALANTKGFAGTFTVMPVGTVAAGSVLCPASKEAGRVAICADCRKCDGSGNAVYIPAHGATRNNYTGKRPMLPTL